MGIPASFSKMKTMQEIHMKNNELTDFDFAEPMKNLHIVDLSHNQLTSSPDLSGHNHLIELNLAHNQLPLIPFVKSVHTYNISHNNISTLLLIKGHEKLANPTIQELTIEDLESSQDGGEESISLTVARQNLNENRLSVLGNSLVFFNIAGNQIRELD